ncbi:cytochrome C biosynthesis protein [uncultured Parabacteroides sp.]|uniref:TolB family protein n=1 Tax=uncultured Parabacteroides sp. TaxID=512312 RepID=UPI002622A2BA|nr:cytochrome C biosynthesis protein [uncultured Parabacteroides sp.]
MKPFIILLYIILMTACSQEKITPDAYIDKPPTLFPDYTAVTFPVNIAPPNFQIEEDGEEFYVEIGFEDKVVFTRKNKKGEIIIPLKQWHKLASAAAGNEFYIRISIRQKGKWTQYKEIRNSISAEPIDPYLAYRLLYPGYELWNQMGIYQRDLTSYEEIPIIENRSDRSTCMNCHTFFQNNPETMMIHIRGNNGGTIISRNGNIGKVDVKKPGMSNGGTYAAWHPGGRYIAYSVNEIQQFFHSTGKKPIEVSDRESDLIVWDCETNRLITDSLIYGPEWMETFPTWSPDGKTLYFCRSKAITPRTSLDSIYYDLYKIPFDARRQTFGKPECVYEASAFHKSISFPRISPDGNYLMFTCSDYGNFSIWHPESELYLLNLQNGNIRNMQEVNSDNVESFHTWSSSGKWFVFSSKRVDGLWAHPFIAYFNPETGLAGKPFMVPQKNPEYYKTFIKTFNLPELITVPITENKQGLKQIRNKLLSSPPN